MKILIVDDNPHISKLLTMNLEKEGFGVLHAADGEEGLQKISSDRPDLVISDVMMPKLDGISMCLKIRTESPTPMIPFMFLTSIDSDVSLKRGFRTGADQYLIKSEISRDMLMSKINEMIRHLKKLKDLATEGAAIRGELSELSLIEILQWLHLRQETGVLTLQRPSTPEGTVRLKNGEVLTAAMGEEKNERALHIMSGWKRGSFAFDHAEESTPASIRIPTLELILSSCRPA